MSYMVKEDGKVEFSCHGCTKIKTTDSLARLPKGWCITGILVNVVDPELASFDDEPPTDQKLRELNEQLAAHFCSVKCAKKKLHAPKVKEYVERMGATLVLYGKSEVIVDGSPAKVARLKERKAKKWVHPENRREDDAGDDPGADRGGDGPDLGKPKSPPPFKLGDGGSPI